jgi:hypothetical protein
MSNPIHVAGLLGLIAFWIGPAILGARIADRKGRNLSVYLIAGLIIGPLVLLVALILPRRRQPV